MNIFTKNFTPPVGFTTDKYCCFPTDSSFFESDYEAVMASKVELRLWSDSTWATDDFTKKENKEDLVLHEIDNKNHSVYGYMFYDLDKKYCYGSLYLNPLKIFQSNYIITQGTCDALGEIEARVDLWIRADEPAAHKELVLKVTNWLKETWKIKAGYVLRGNMVSLYT